MSLTDAKRVLQWQVVTEALTEAGIDTDTIALVEHARHIHETVYSMVRALLGGADAKQAKNYVKVETVGLIPPFDRIYIELTRPGGKTSHELRELLRERLQEVRRKLAEGEPSESIIDGIDEDLAKEAP